MTLTDDQMIALRQVLEDRGDLRWAYLFGSAARRGAHLDVDVAVMPSGGPRRGGPGALDLGRLVADLEAALGEQVDLFDLRSAELPFAGQMLEEDHVLLLDRDTSARHEWEAETTSRWIDFRPAYAATKPRGQHTEIPFESMNFGLRGLPDELHTKCADDELGDVVREAIRRGRRRCDVVELLDRMLGEIVALRERFRGEVRGLL